MIPVQGFEGRLVAVLGLGRTGLAAASALVAGGARVVVWDDSQTARDAAHDAGYDLRDLTGAAALTQVCSTGVIGAPLPMDALVGGIPKALAAAHVEGLPEFAEAIRTTDGFRKLRSTEWTSATSASAISWILRLVV